MGKMAPDLSRGARAELDLDARSEAQRDPANRTGVTRYGLVRSCAERAPRRHADADRVEP